jgi:hypothetical protein
MHPLATRFQSLRVALVLALLACGLSTIRVAQAFDWQIEVTPAGELFPALDLSQAPRSSAGAVGGGNGLVSVRVRGTDLPTQLRVRIDTPGLRHPAVVEVTPAPSVAELRLHPRFDWDIAALRSLREVRRQVLRVTLQANGVTEARQVELRLHPLDDAPYFVREGKDQVDLGWAFAGYVDPRDPVVDAVLAEARRIDPRFDADGQPALLRVRAIWAALEQRGLRYDEGDPALSRGPAVWSQRVRLLEETWRDRRANCIDASVLIAALLERIGLRAQIVLVPGHAFVGYREGDGAAEYLETTLLGASGTPAVNFDAARRAGRARWRKAAPKLDGRHGPHHALVDIGTARAYGIIPLGTAERARQHPSLASPAPAAAPRKRGSP